MNNKAYQEALAAAEELKDYSDDGLYEELGLRIGDILNIGGYQRSMHYSEQFSQVAEDMLAVDDIRRIGRRWWEKLRPELLKIICDPKNEDLKKMSGGKTIPQIAASLATSALISTLAPPAWLIVATSILAAKIVETGLEAICEELTAA